MEIPKLTKLGFCPTCNEWYEIQKDTSCLPVHKKKEGEEKCYNSQCSPSEYEYLIKTDEEARSLADFIRKDDGRCLFGRGRHSLNCGDGRDCNHERRRLARALAEYYLEYRKKLQIYV